MSALHLPVPGSFGRFGLLLGLVGLLVMTGCDAPPTATDCPTPEEFFALEVEPWLVTRCGGCHTAGGAAGESRLTLRGDRRAGARAANYALVQALAEEQIDGTSTLLAKPSDRHPQGHGGGAILRDGSQELAALGELVERIRGALPPCGESTTLVDCADEAPAAGPRTLRRLSRRSYGNSVRDLLGLEVQPELGLVPDTEVDGYDNDADGLSVQPLLAEQLAGLAESLASQAVEERLHALAPCADEGDEACARSVIEHQGRRFFRRPLSPEERAAWLDLWRLAAIPESAARADFAEGLRWVLIGWLQSPHFLYRAELGARQADGLFALGPWERATALSYLVWQSTPDDTLLDAAEAGLLDDEEGLLEQLDRLLADPRAEATLADFTERWLGLQRLDQVVREHGPSPALRSEMRAEARALVADALQAGDWTALFLTDQTTVGPELAAHYGLERALSEPDADGRARYALDDTPYLGLLTLGAVTVTHALPDESSPIHRGLLVRERLLCQPLPEPPANLDTAPPAPDPDASTRERFAQHSSDPACSGCHDLIDPIGFGFEHFDEQGRYREAQAGAPIDAHGSILSGGSADGEFEGVAGLTDLLLQSDELASCLSQQWVHWGTGLSEGRAPRCTDHSVAQSLHQEGDLASLFRSLVLSVHFHQRTGEAAELDGPMTDPAEWNQPDPEDPVEDPENPTDDPEDPADDPAPPSGEASVSPGATLDISWNDWGHGYCVDITVTNDSDSPLTWWALIPLPFAPGNVWSSHAAPEGDLFRFTGQDFNATLNPGQRAGFGACGWS